MATKLEPKKKIYSLEMLFNGLSFKKRTDDIAKTILQFKPEVLYTEVYVIVKRGKDITERRLNLRQGKNLFVNEDYLPIFINNLLLE